MDGLPWCFKYCWERRRVQGGGSSNCWCVVLLRCLNLLLEIQVRKLAAKMFEFLLLFCAYAWTESKDFTFHMHGQSALSAVQFTVPGFLGFTFHKTLELREKEWQIYYRWTPCRFRQWTGGPFTEPCVLLQTAGTVQTVLSVTSIWKFWFYVCVYVLLYNYVQLARSVKWNSCNHASPLRIKFSVSIVRCQKVLNTDILRRKIWRQLLKHLETAIFVYV